MIVLDTNVLSELMRRAPTPAVVRWVESQPVSSLHTTSVTQAEILHGVALLPRGSRRDAIAQAAEAMFARELGGRVLPFGSDAARAYARIAAARRERGRPMSTLAAQIAAIAAVAGATLATRNATDFEHCGIVVHDPWSP